MSDEKVCPDGHVLDPGRELCSRCNKPAVSEESSQLSNMSDEQVQDNVPVEDQSSEGEEVKTEAPEASDTQLNEASAPTAPAESNSSEEAVKENSSEESAEDKSEESVGEEIPATPATSEDVSPEESKEEEKPAE